MKTVVFLLALLCLPVAMYFLKQQFFPAHPFDPKAALEQEQRMSELKEAELEFKTGVTVQHGKGITTHPYPQGATWLPAVELTAESPVSVSYIPAEYENHLDDPGLNRRRGCLNEHVNKIRFLCPFTSTHAGYLLYIQDEHDRVLPWPDNKIHLMVWRMPPDSKFARDLIKKQNDERHDPQRPQ